MRIISQNGNYDLPYGICILSVNDKYINATVGMGCVVIAEYGSAEKVKKAMDLLHQEYIGGMPSLVIDNNSALDEEAMKALWESTSEVIARPADDSSIEVHMLPRVFRFPADDEIEVSNE